MTLLKLHFPDVCDVADEALPLQLDSHAFVLCDRSNRNLHWTTQEEEEANAEEQRLKRQDSLTSRASSKMSSAVSCTSSCCVVNLKLKCWHFYSYSFSAVKFGRRFLNMSILVWFLYNTHIPSELLVFRKFPEIRKFWKDSLSGEKINKCIICFEKKAARLLTFLMWYFIHLNNLSQAFELRYQEN